MLFSTFCVHQLHEVERLRLVHLFAFVGHCSRCRCLSLVGRERSPRPWPARVSQVRCSALGQLPSRQEAANPPWCSQAASCRSPPHRALLRACGALPESRAESPASEPLAAAASRGVTALAASQLAQSPRTVDEPPRRRLLGPLARLPERASCVPQHVHQGG